ncbi:MAG: YfhO family protein [Atopobiaceae bacterium]|jgi:uncharacterized membrane protein YfhO|nr:YfhO family protein [Atopobiaceae bacterium]
MDWTRFGYLIAVLVASIPLVVAMTRLMPELAGPSPRQTRQELVVLGLVLALGVAAIYGSFLAGTSYFSYWDVGSDTSEQYVPFYINMLDGIRAGTFGPWNSRFGLGESFIAYQSWVLDPFNLVLVPLGLMLGDARLGLVLVIVQVAKVFLSGYLFDRILLRYAETPIARLVGSTLYAFGGFLLLWGQHYWLGTAYVLCTLLILALEGLMSRWSVPRFLGVALSVAVSIGMSAYVGFMIMLFATVYALLRTLHLSRCTSLAGFARAFMPLVVPVLCGCLLSCASLVPYAETLLGESSRVTGSQGSASGLAAQSAFVPLRWVPAILSRILGDSLISSGADIPETLVPATAAFPYVNVYEFIMVGFSGSAFVLIAQFFHWAVRKASRRDKALVFVASLLVLMYCFNFFLPSLSNLFVAPKYRSSFALAIPFGIALTVGFEKGLVEGRCATVPLVAGAGLTACVLAWSLANTVNGRLACLFYIAALCLVVGLAVLRRSRPESGAILALLCMAIVSTSLVDGFFVTNNRLTSTASNFPKAEEPGRGSDTEEALAYLSQRDGSSYRVEKLYTDWTRLSDSLVEGYRGVSAYSSVLDSDIDDFYENLWPGALDGSAYQVFSNSPDEPEILSLLNVKYLLSKDELPFGWCQLVDRVGSVYVYQNMSARGTLSSWGSVMGEGEAARIPTPEERAKVLGTSLIVPDSALQGLEGVDLSSEATTTCVETGGSSVEGTVDASSDTVVYLAIPHTAGWTVCVDGSPVETFRADYGFIGFQVGAGSHVVTASFEPVGTATGIAVSLAGLCATVVSCAIGKRAGARKAIHAEARSPQA